MIAFFKCNKSTALLFVSVDKKYFPQSNLQKKDLTNILVKE